MKTLTLMVFSIFLSSKWVFQQYDPRVGSKSILNTVTGFSWPIWTWNEHAWSDHWCTAVSTRHNWKENAWREIAWRHVRLVVVLWCHPGWACVQTAREMCINVSKIVSTMTWATRSKWIVNMSWVHLDTVYFQLSKKRSKHGPSFNHQSSGCHSNKNWATGLLTLICP